MVQWGMLGDIVGWEIVAITVQTVSEKLILALFPELEMTNTPSKLDIVLTHDEERAVMYAGDML